MIKWILRITGLLLIIDTIIISFISNMNFGVIMPCIIGTPLFIYGMFYNKLNLIAKQKPWKIIKIIIQCSYIAFTLLFLATLTIMCIYASKPPEPNADAVIVLGAGLRGEALSLTFKARLNAAEKYLKENPETICFLTGGQGSGELRPESAAARDYLISHGIEENRILTEEKSTSTYENLLFAKEVLDEKFKEEYSVVVVSSDFHVYRAMLNATKEVGFNDVSTVGSRSAWYMVLNNYLRECSAIVRTWVLGTY